MKVFSLNEHDMIDVWANTSEYMYSKIFKSSVMSEWFVHFCESLMNRASSLYSKFAWYCNPAVADNDKLELIGKFCTACAQKDEIKMGAEIGIVDMTDDSDEAGSKKGCVSDLVLRTDEEFYEQTIRRMTFDANRDKLDKLREDIYIFDSVDIYVLMANLAEASKGITVKKQKSLALLKQVITKYNLKDLICEVMEDGAGMTHVYSVLEEEYGYSF